MAYLLIVEDDENLHELFRLSLESGGYTVSVVNNADEALALLDRMKKVDLIILDLMLPGMDGIALCKVIRARPDTATTPIIIMSASIDPLSRHDGLAAGANEYLSKPILKHDLLGKVRAALKEPPQQEATAVAAQTPAPAIEQTAVAPRIQKALVLDDNVDACRICGMILGALGYEVRAIQDSTLGLQVLTQQSFDLLVLDLQMPGINGREVLQKVRAMDRHKDLIVMVMTAQSHMVTEDIHEKADCVLQKPIDVAIFAQLARRLTKIPSTGPLTAPKLA
jgi:CheY-like chemotaxis protein